MDAYEGWYSSMDNPKLGASQTMLEVVGLPERVTSHSPT